MKSSEVGRICLGSHLPVVLWFTGLPGAGKTTIAEELQIKLLDKNCTAVLFDGDSVRCGLSKDLGFSDEDRAENTRRIAEVSKLVTDAGLSVIVAMISPFRREREMAKSILKGVNFIETFIDAPLEVCEIRDPKGLYAKARHGKISQFTGIDSRYQAPENPDLHIDTVGLSVEEAVDSVLQFLKDGKLTEISAGG